MSSKLRRIISAFTASSLMILSCINSFVSYAESGNNSFLVEYTEDTDDITARLSIGKGAALNSFKGVFTYDSSKYTVLDCSAKANDTLVYSQPEKGKVIVALGVAKNITDEAIFCEVVFHPLSVVNKTDFNFKFDEEPENDEFEAVDYTIKDVWNDESGGNIENTDTTTSTVTSLKTTTTSTFSEQQTTTTAINDKNDKNIFYYYSEKNDEFNTVDFIFGVKGDVDFAAIDGIFNLKLEGLSAPDKVSDASGMLSYYSENENAINFIFTSPSGKNLNEPTELFRYCFEIENDDYILSVSPIIKSVSDINCDEIYDYAFVNEDENDNHNTTSTSTTETSTTTTTTTVTTKSTIETTTRTTKSTTETSNTDEITTTSTTTEFIGSTNTSTESTTTTIETTVKVKTTLPIISIGEISMPKYGESFARSEDILTSKGVGNVEVVWYKMDANTIEPMDTETFEEGYEYFAEITVFAADSYEFAEDITINYPSNAELNIRRKSIDGSAIKFETNRVLVEKEKQTETTITTTSITTTTSTSTTAETTTTFTTTTATETSSTTTTTTTITTTTAKTTTSTVTTATTPTKPTETTVNYADVNNDGNVDALDASAILTEYAKIATNSGSDFNAEQKKAADVNFDGSVDALDASIVLGYYAYKATGGTLPILDYLKK